MLIGGSITHMSQSKGDFIIIFFIFICQAECGLHKALTVTILSQPAGYDETVALTLQKSLFQQASELKEDINVFISSIDFRNVTGNWAVWPLLNRIKARLNSQIFDWLFVCESTTTVHLEKLLGFLRARNAEEEHFIGRALKDKKPVIIHHYHGFGENEKPVQFPDFAAGMAISKGLFKKVLQVLPEDTARKFSIDPKHEFAMLVASVGVLLIDNREFCLLSKETRCITRFTPPSHEICKTMVTEDDILFAVKTHSGNHNSRIVVVKRTWGKDAKHIRYFSDIDDPFVPTINLGINNTVRGHCGKTEAILKYFSKRKEFNNMRWLVIADDDTLLSAHRLKSLLSCYDADQKLILGERYGYGFDVDGLYGYDYPTGGAGMVFSRKAAIALGINCICPSIDAPDDMILGLCAHGLGIPVIHSAAFHQAQPLDYASLYLKRLLPISFHKFENIDPYSVYVELLQDRQPFPHESKLAHEEL